MGRRALSLVAIALWLLAGAAFAVFGVRAIRLEREAATSEARRLAESAVQAGVLHLPAAVSEALAGTTARFRIVDAEASPASDPAPAISPEDALILDQAAYVERAGRAPEALALLARLTEPASHPRTTAIACLRAGALALAGDDEERATSRLQTAAAAPISWRDPEGVPIAPAAWRLLAPIEARAGRRTR